MDNRVQVLKSVPVNLSLNPEHQETKREQFSSSTGPGAAAAVVASSASGDSGSSAAPVAVVKAEMYAPVFMTGAGLHYRLEGEEPARVVYEQSPYEVTTVSHSSYVKEDQQSPPDSPYEEERDEVGGLLLYPRLQHSGFYVALPNCRLYLVVLNLNFLKG